MDLNICECGAIPEVRYASLCPVVRYEVGCSCGRHTINCMYEESAVALWNGGVIFDPVGHYEITKQGELKNRVITFATESDKATYWFEQHRIKSEQLAELEEQYAKSQDNVAYWIKQFNIKCREVDDLVKEVNRPKQHTCNNCKYGWFKPDQEKICCVWGNEVDIFKNDIGKECEFWKGETE